MEMILPKLIRWPVLCLCIITFQIVNTHAQGITSSNITGRVYDNENFPLPGAHVVLVHTPTGANYGGISREEGRFNFPNIKVGGPYTLTISFLGFEDHLIDNIYLRLGQEYVADVSLTPIDFEMEAVQIVATKEAVFSEDRTGAATNVDSDALEKLPTIRRSLQDFIRLNPQASSLGQGISFVGMNNRYNNFSIDGTVNNDVFGLNDSGTNGGETGTQPISLDAVKEVQVEVAPFDVRYGGFIGGSINVITRQGSNDITGSAYYLVNNEVFSGNVPADVSSETRLPEYFEKTIGLHIGAPIRKDKLFLFVSLEHTKREDPTLFNVGDTSPLTLDEAMRVENKLVELSTNDQGGFDSFITNKKFFKVFARADWNINDQHKLTLRHNYVYAKQVALARSQRLMKFNNTAKIFPSTTNSTVLEIQSRITNNKANELRIGFTKVREEQNFPGEPFPFIFIRNMPTSVVAGTDRLFTADELDQDIITLTDHFTIFKGNHIITLGTHNEFYSIKHLEIIDNFGSYFYNGIESFEAIGTPDERRPIQYQYSYSKIEDQPRWAPSFNALQMAFYAQDEIYVNDHLKLIGGLRAEIPVILDDPGTNDEFNEEFKEFGVATDKLPDARIMLSPRLGFNLSASKDRSSQIRGGMGMFISRVPFVWFSNQFSHTGNELATIFLRGPQVPASLRFGNDPFNPPGPDEGLPETSEINVTDPDFKYPKVLRFNLGYDRKLPWWGLVGSTEFIYSKNINAVSYKDLNLSPSQQNILGADNRPFFSSEPISGAYTRVLMMTNTDRGHSFNFSLQVQKPIENGITGSLAYSFGRSRDVNSTVTNSSVANWSSVEQVFGPNDLLLTTSKYDTRSRISGFFQITRKLYKSNPTTVGLFYNGQSGIGMSYIYDSDVNNDQATNDLIYIPRNASEIKLVDNNSYSAAEQWEALDKFITNDDYLNSRRGSYAQRNGKRLPFEHQFDLKFMQEFIININNQPNRFQISFDIFNLANLLNKDWGKRYVVSNQRVELLELDGNTASTDPRFTFDVSSFQSQDDLWTFNSERGRWRGQLGLRYIFD